MAKKTIKTFKELSEIDLEIGGLYKENPTLKNSKFGYAYKRFATKNYYPTLDILKEKMGDLAMDNALEVDGAIVIDEKNPYGYGFSKSGWKTLTKKVRELNIEMDGIEIDIEPFFCKKENLPKELLQEHIELLKGLVIE